eukprot:scaffold34602_cov129-Skeletonema_dohrnii-CCMP3373.AAC.1
MADVIVHHIMSERHCDVPVEAGRDTHNDDLSSCDFPGGGTAAGLCRVAIPPENDCMALTELRFPRGNDEEATMRTTKKRSVAYEK